MKFRTIIFLTLISIGIFPLFSSIVFNLPKVLDILEKAAQEKRISELQAKLHDFGGEIARRQESLRLFAMTPGPKDLVGRDVPQAVSAGLIVKRLGGLTRDWFGKQQEVLSLVVIDGSGRERFKAVRGEDGVLRVNQEALAEREDDPVYQEGRKAAAGSGFVGAVRLETMPQPGRHRHRAVALLGISLLGRDRGDKGVAVLELNLHSLFPDLTEYYLVRQDGTYLTVAGHDPRLHGHTVAADHHDFPALQGMLQKGIPGVVANSEGEEFAWLPLLLDKHGSHTLWIGQPVDRSAIEQWVAGFKRNINLIAGGLILAVILIASFLAQKGEHIKQQLMSGLARIINEGQKPQIAWSWPHELRELSRELDLLAETNMESRKARQLAEDTLRSEKEQAQVTLQSIGDAVIATDTLGLVTRMNTVAENLTGWSQDAAVGQPLSNVFVILDAQSRKRAECPVGRVLESGNIVGLANHTLLLSKEGIEYQIADSAAPIRNVDGDVFGVVLVFRDVTEEYAMGELLEYELLVKHTLTDLSRELLGKDFDMGAVAALVLEKAKFFTGSAHGYVGTIDGATGNLICHTHTGMMEKSCMVSGADKRIIFPRGEDGRYPALWGCSLNEKRSFFTNKPADHPASAGCPAGHVGVDQFMAVNVMLGDELVGQIALANPGRQYVEKDLATIGRLADHFAQAVAGLRDRAERERLLQNLRQSQKMEAVGTLAGGVAHDFNNMLTPILGYTELLLAQLPPADKMRENLSEIKKAAQRARSLVQQILTFSRQRENEMICVQVQPIVKECLKMLRSSLPTTIEIKENIDNECGSVMADPTQLQQVLINICTNAAHAMEERGGTLEVELRERSFSPADELPLEQMRPGNYVCLEVRDTGCGMDTAILDRIFEPYFTTKPQGKGTGIGLALVHGIIKSHGGHIRVDSEKGGGTTFGVYLPVCCHQEEGMSSIVNTSISRGSERVLLVDDEEQVVKMLQEMLDYLGYSVVDLTDSVEALRLFTERPGDFDVVITDQTMPHLTGADLAAKIIEIRPDLPVIICTGYSEAFTEEKARELGISKYLMKPVTIGDLSRAIREVCNRRQD